MSIKIFNKEKFTTSLWAGGKTTQLYIFPEGSSLAEMNFTFRLSSAQVEIEESAFTPMPGYVRKLMVLERELFLEHEDQHAVFLKPFDQDLFLGDWSTRSKGKVVDFNVIVKPEIDSEITHMHLGANDMNVVSCESNTFIYVYSGSVELLNKRANCGDLIAVNEETNVFIVAPEECDLIIVHIRNRE